MSDLEILAITRDDVLYRYLSTDEIEPDGETVTPQAYYDKDHEGPDGDISVFLGRLVRPDALLNRLSKQKWAGTRIGRLSAAVPMGMPGLSVAHTPQDGGPAHVTIKGVHSDRQCRLLALATIILPGER